MTLYCPESTVRIEVLGEELRRLRDLCGLTLTQVVARLGISETALSRWETGRRAPSPEDVSALLVIYGVTGEERRELLALARRSSQWGLWQRHGSYEARFKTLKILEARATKLVNFEPLVMPGLLQTMPYAQATIRDVALIEDQEEIDNRVVDRIHRQAILRKPGSPHLIAIVTETALRNQIGGREAMRDQLRYLAEVAARPKISLLVVPTAVGGHPGLNGPFLRMQFVDRPGVVFLGNRTSSLFLEDPAEIAIYDRMIAELLTVAMTEENSVRLVAEMAATLE